MFFSRKNKFLRKLRYKTDQQGILNRYLRETEGWHTHLDNTKNYIKEVALQTTGQGACLVLGSGWLLDVPLEELAAHFKHVYLIDIVQPPQVQHKIRKLENVSTIAADITGGAAEAVFKALENSQKTPLTRLQFAPRNFGLPGNVKINYCISLNVLNQLDVLIADYIKQTKLYPNSEIEEFRKTIQLQHIKALPKGKSSLITDYEEEIYDNKNRLEKTNSRLFIRLPKGKNEREWKWHFDTKKTFYVGKMTHFKVKAMEL